MELDPLQITDVAIKPLGSSSTDLALISYMLTEAATVYVSIYPPLTSISVNTVPPNTGGVQPLRTFIEQKDRRVTAITYWDGRDDAGHPVCDGDYMYAIYAALPSAAAGAGGVVRTTKTQVGTVPVNRGSVLAFMSQSSTVIGSSPTATNLDPFYFRYTPVRDAFVSLNIKKMDGTSIVRQVVTNSLRTGNYSARDIWDGKDKDGLYVPSGSYLAELVTTDPFLCASAKTSTVTAQISVDMFRIVDVQAKPLLGGTSDLATVSFELSQPMYVDLNIYDTDAVITPTPWPPAVSPGTVKYNVQGMRPGRFKVTEYWDGRDSNGQMVPDGRYPFTLVAHSTSAPNAQVPMYATDQAYGYVDVSRGQIIFTSFDVSPTIPTMYSSSDDIKLPPYEIDYSLTRQSSVTVEVITMFLPEKVIATVLAGQIRDADIVYKDFWDGKDAFGNFVPGGGYNVRVRAQDITSEMASKATVQMTIDVYPLRLYDVAITPLTLDNPAVINYQVSEPMKVVTKIYKPGTSFDAYGSPRPDDSKSLVKRIIGVRPARTQISESWDGTDLTLAKVPDGNYVFKIYASTDTNAIDTVSGAYATGTNLADDVVTSNITITKSGTTDPCGDFAKMYFAPNPYPGLNGWFHIPLPMTGRVALKIYNIAGDLVYKKDYGERGVGDDIGVHGAAGPCEISHTDPACWPKVNSSGRKVAPGVYFVVARFEASEGTRGVCQTVKKILIP